MNRPHITAREAEDLYHRWYDTVANRVREAAVKARGRRDRHRGDLEALYHQLDAVDLRGLLEPEPDAQAGTPTRAVAEADRLLAEAEQHHAWGAHKTALVWLQQAHHAANHTIELLTGGTAKPDIRLLRSDGPIPPQPTGKADTDNRADDPADPGDGPLLPIPRQRT